MAAPAVVYYVASSLDGFIAAADGGIGWLAPFEDGSEDYGYADFYASIDCILLGRKTYEQALGFASWPYPDRPSWVFSRRALPVAPKNVMVTAEAPRGLLEELRGRGLKRAWLVGGGALAGAFHAAGLISEYIVSVIPVALGSGIGLFGGSGAHISLALGSARTYPSGIVQLRYSKPT